MYDKVGKRKYCKHTIITEVKIFSKPNKNF